MRSLSIFILCLALAPSISANASGLQEPGKKENAAARAGSLPGSPTTAVSPALVNMGGWSSGRRRALWLPFRHADLADAVHTGGPGGK